MLELTIKVCPHCHKKFPLSFSAWSNEINEIMNRQFKNHVYYCEKNVKFIADTYLRNGMVKKDDNV